MNDTKQTDQLDSQPRAEEPEKVDLRSHDIADDKRAELLRLFPEIRTEGGKIDFDRLKLALGESVDVGKERYGMVWPGKGDCFKTIQQPSLGTLRPCPEESVNFETTENLIIEGDNLEVLKLLQKSYLGKVKMIYIDPPYNTGNDFIYPDDYSESLQTYLEYTGQADTEGKRFGTNTEADGRFHSKWLNMICPRLYLARNILKDDGVIFVSIDDNEIQNLRCLMDETFGAENFIATIIWQKVFAPKNTARHFSADHDYIVLYAKNAEAWLPQLLPRSEEANARYSNPDSDPRGVWASDNLLARNYYGAGIYPITCPSGRVIESPPSGNYWRVSKSKFDQLDRDHRIWWGADGNNMPRLKRFLSEVKAGRIPQTLWTYEEAGHTQEAKKELLDFVAFENTDNVLDTVKPTRLIRRMLQIATKPNDSDVVVDFFAGSGSTAHALLKQNQEDGGNRRVILVQLPEPLPKPEKRLTTIADICKERVRRVIQELNDEDTKKLDLSGGQRQDRGFRLFKLAESNFHTWNANVARENLGALEKQLEIHVDHVRDGRTDADFLYEVLLKSGYPPTAVVEKLNAAHKTFYSVSEGLLIVCLEKEITHELIKAMADRKPERVVCLDEGFAGNDQLKTNAVQTMKAKGVTSFKTV